MEEHGREPRKQTRTPRIIPSRREEFISPDDGPGEDFSYFAYKGPDILADLKKKIEEREKIHFDLIVARESLDGNPETGVHDTTRTVGPEKTPIPCQCGACELIQVNKLIASNEYAIRRMRALFARMQ